MAGPPVCTRRGKKPTVSFGPHFLAQKFTDKSWCRGWEFKKRDRSPLCWQTLRLWEECIGGVGSPRRIRYGFINEQQAAVAVAIAYLVVSIWKEWEQERERARRRGIERKNREYRWQTQGKRWREAGLRAKRWRDKVSRVISAWVIAGGKAEDTASLWQCISPFLF